MGFTSSESAWFECVPGKPKEGMVKMRLVSGTKTLEIKKATTTQDAAFKSEKEGGPLQRIPFEVEDSDRALEMRVDASILEWKDITLDGKPLKCTVKNKMELFYNNRAFQRFYSDSMNKLREDEEKRFGTGDEVKN